MYVLVDGVWSPWSAWNRCTQTCGSESTHTRRQSCSAALYGGSQTCDLGEENSETEPCSVSECPGKNKDW